MWIDVITRALKVHKLAFHTHLLILLLIHLQSQEKIFMLKAGGKNPRNYFNN